MEIERIKQELEEGKYTALEVMAYLEYLNKNHRGTLIRFAEKYPTLGCIDVKAFIL